jgi:hypothetical protein
MKITLIIPPTADRTSRILYVLLLTTLTLLSINILKAITALLKPYQSVASTSYIYG